MAEITIKTKSIGVRTDQIKWAESNSINFGKLVRSLIDKEIARRGLLYSRIELPFKGTGNVTEDKLKIKLADEILYRYGVNIGKYYELVDQSEINIELHDHRIW